MVPVTPALPATPTLGGHLLLLWKLRLTLARTAFARIAAFPTLVGALLTIGGAYLYDSHNAAQAIDTPAVAQRPMVNWDVVGVKWQHLTERARSEWTRVAG